MGLKSKKIPFPWPPHPETLQDARSTIRGQSPAGPVLCVYCSRNRAGALFFESVGMWRVYTPIDVDELLRSIESSGIKLPDGADLQTWLDQVTGRAALNG